MFGRPRLASRFPVLSVALVIGLVTLPHLAALAQATPAAASATATPIKHLVVIFDENESFDHYFGTYPVATNPPGEPAFTALPDTPAVNGLNAALLTQNPNSSQPQRLDRRHALTCDMDHEYTAEQQAYNRGLLDRFPEETEGQPNAAYPQEYCPNGIVMDFFDGNTVTALWNYAQHFAMSDNHYGTNFGPSTPGALHLVAADTAPAVCGPSNIVFGGVPACGSTPPQAGAGVPLGTDVSDADPYYDDCSKGGPSDKSATMALSGRNIGDLLNTAGVTWGWFEGGFDDCTAKHPNVAYDRVAGIDPATDPQLTKDYNPHHEPFQYFPSTANPHHQHPTSVAMVGHSDRANHQYDLTDFWAAGQAGNLPAVSFLKAPSYQDGHPGYSDPLDEQAFLVDTVNRIQQLPQWSSTAVIITYDDSDGWYDHVLGPIVNHSATPLDVGCGTTNDGAPARCGYGPRLPYLVISPFAKANYVDHAVIDQTSTVRFIEDNWLHGQRISAQSFDNLAGDISGLFDFAHPRHEPPLLLDPVTGEPAGGASTPPAS